MGIKRSKPFWYTNLPTNTNLKPLPPNLLTFFISLILFVFIGLDIIDKNYNIKRTEIFCGDQSDQNILNKIIKKYKSLDIVVDDGSHKNNDIKNSFNFLFPKLNFGGLYIIEDLQTSYIPNWGGDGVNLNNEETIMNFIRSLADRMHYQDIDNPFYFGC